jgi:spore maturation protein CgeB
MKFLILNTDYSEFLNMFYKQYLGLEFASFDKQMSARNRSLFSTADFYSSNLRKLGHDAWDIHINNEFMQKAWAREHLAVKEDASSDNPLKLLDKYMANHGRLIPESFKALLSHLKVFLNSSAGLYPTQPSWYYNILLSQINFYKPDIILNLDLYAVSTNFLKEVKSDIKLLIGQHSGLCNFRDDDLRCYDLIISAFLPTIDYFNTKGIPAKLNRLGFDQRILKNLRNDKRNIDVSFVGSFFSVHGGRMAWLEYLCDLLPQLQVWGPDINNLPLGSSIRKRYMGPAWGLEMYQILSNSKITLNCHGDIPPYAANMRLYEATGAGALLITDWKPNLREIFEPGKEVVAYRTPEECADQIQYYLEHDEDRESIARAGRERTLREHTYYRRVKELLDMIDDYMVSHNV